MRTRTCPESTALVEVLYKPERDAREKAAASCEGCGRLLKLYQATFTVSVPRPLTSPTIVSPETTAATPSGVPV